MLSHDEILYVSQIEKFLIRWAIMLASKYETYEKALSHIYDPGPYKIHLDKGSI